MVYTLGETTYDIIFKNGKPIDSKIGGSTLNTSISLGRLGVKPAFVSELGYDQLGRMSLEFLKENGVQTQFVQIFEGNSRVALAFLDASSNASYSFYQASGKISAFQWPELNTNDVILFGSSFATKDENRSSLISFLQKAKDLGVTIIYDPNFRKGNLDSNPMLKQKIMENIQLATIVKGSDEDFFHIWGSNDPAFAYGKIKDLGCENLIYTASYKGAWLFSGSLIKTFDVPVIVPVSTIGAGDNFSAGIIYTIEKLRKIGIQLADFTEKQWAEVIQNSICFSQHVCMHFDNYLSVEFASRFYIS